MRSHLCGVSDVLFKGMQGRPVGQAQPAVCYYDTILLEHSHIHHSHISHGCYYAATEELSSCDKDYLALHRKSLPMPSLVTPAIYDRF